MATMAWRRQPEAPVIRISSQTVAATVAKPSTVKTARRIRCERGQRREQGGHDGNVHEAEIARVAAAVVQTSRIGEDQATCGIVRLVEVSEWSRPAPIPDRKAEYRDATDNRQNQPETTGVSRMAPRGPEEGYRCARECQVNDVGE
jgi:hypothetical protein